MNLLKVIKLLPSVIRIYDRTVIFIFRANEESRIKEKLKAEKKDRLEHRRKRLAHFLAVENEQYMVNILFC